MPTQEPETHLADSQTHGLGEITVHHPTGTFGITPASRISIEALGTPTNICSREQVWTGAPAPSVSPFSRPGSLKSIT